MQHHSGWVAFLLLEEQEEQRAAAEAAKEEAMKSTATSSTTSPRRRQLLKKKLRGKPCDNFAFLGGGEHGLNCVICGHPYDVHRMRLWPATSTPNPRA